MQHTTIKARGLEFDALTDGPEDGELLLLLHGLPRSSWEWHHQIPALAALGFQVVAPDLRGYCAGARPSGVEAYHVQEFVDDALEQADALKEKGASFHLMGTSIGSAVAWRLAALNPHRVLTLACLNVPHPGAFREAKKASQSDAKDQRERFGYFEDAKKPGNERAEFARMLETLDLSAEESAPYRKALDSDEALEAVYNWYRANGRASEREEPLPKCPMPTLFVWPSGWHNISPVVAELNATQVTGPYTFAVLEDGKQPVLQAEPDKMTSLLVEHLRTHAS
ncbi:MAG: alpha/beta fold hydrolase [Acidimicrobiales bacterium]|nr:alpha/beta fold hydrolase [Acidimicrobiales bacterium]